MFDAVTAGIRKWVVELFVTAIKNTSRPEERHAAIQWLLKSRDILASDLGMAEKLMALNALLNARAAVKGIAGFVQDAVKNYKSSKLSWPMKVAMPATLAAIPVVGVHGAGIAAFGSAIGLPVLLLVFLGTAGITSVIESVATHPNSRAGMAIIVDLILRADASRKASAAFKQAMREAAAAPEAVPMPEDEAAIRETLLTMDPKVFEKHVMSYFERAGLYASAQGKPNDFGIDGIAEYEGRLIVVQCKRHGPHNKVGRPALQQFASVIRDEGAWRGYFVTSSTFSRDAIEYAAQFPEMILVDVDALVRWEKEGWSV